MIPAASTLERAQAVLVVVDLQERLAAVMHHRERVLERTRLLLKVAALADVPIIATRQYPQGLGDYAARLADALAEHTASGGGIVHVDKMTFDCFAEPAFVEAVCRSGRKQLLVVGMETHICVTQTALSGLREGFDVHVAADACCSREDASHESTLARLGHAGVVVTIAESAAYELVGQAGTNEFRALLAAVKSTS